jgi:transcriptional regulator with XRE-family HTH domain
LQQDSASETNYSVADSICLCEYTGMKLTDYITRTKLTIPELAERLGLSRPYVTQLLNGTRGASVKTAKQIQERTGGKVKAADVLGI